MQTTTQIENFQQYYKDPQAARDAEIARIRFLECGRGAELFDKIVDGKATDADREEYARLAEERGISRAESEDLIAAACEEIAEVQNAGSERPATAPGTAASASELIN